jgi:hypothetical protein
MSHSDEQILELIRLVHALETASPYVTVARLRHAARARNCLTKLTATMPRLVARGVGMHVLFSDNRLELTRSGSFRPIRIYRVNWRHALVQQALDGGGTK